MYSFATLANNTKLDIRELLREEKQPKSPSSTGGEITHWIHTIEHYPSVTLNTQTWTHRQSPTLSKGRSSQESVCNFYNGCFDVNDDGPKEPNILYLLFHFLGAGLLHRLSLSLFSCSPPVAHCDSQEKAKTYKELHLVAGTK